MPDIQKLIYIYYNHNIQMLFDIVNFNLFINIISYH
jgi:hypothetical protein